MAESVHGVRITSKDGDVHKIPSVEEVQAGLNLRQKTLTAGNNITIQNNEISATCDDYDDTEIRAMIESIEYINVEEYQNTFV
jgi:hypothetical protein